MSNLISVGVIKAIFNPKSSKKPEKPVLQVAKIAHNEYSSLRPQRLKVALNDGCELVQGIIPVNSVGASRNINRGQLLRLTHYNCLIKPSLETKETLKIIIVINYELVDNQLYPIFHSLSPPQVRNIRRTPLHTRSLQQSNAFESNYTIDEEFFPISTLSPYYNTWKIEALVGTKSDVRYWKKFDGTGKWFSVVLYDSSGEIRATAFEQQVDEFYDQLQVGKLYEISKAKVGSSNKKYSSIIKNEYELFLGRETIIREVLDKDTSNFMAFNFVKISDLFEYEKDEIIDIIGLVIEVSNFQEITIKSTRRNVNKRSITMIDQSQYQVTLALWSSNAEKFDKSLLNHVIACKNVRVGDFQGRNLTLLNDSLVIRDPKIKETKALLDWYNINGSNLKFTKFTMQYNDDIKTLEQVKYEKLGQDDKVDFFLIMATITFIKKGTISYPACPTCFKKVNQIDNEWQCVKCSQSYKEPEHRYILSAILTDFTGNSILTFFNDTADKIMEIDVNELLRLRDEDEDRYHSYFENATCKSYFIKCRAKTDTYITENENTYEERSSVRYNAMDVSPVDYVIRAKKLYQIISDFEEEMFYS
ncbi:replication factor-a protein [Gigaspora margarita]|uniref:Replication protein A subunit n=1 Tax=Gigaspora margarita TaxID=4874 RepID=A0A8H4AYP4_GIGMA|nr:replication factor-a protein [Gigaspora margarita]